MLKRLVLLAAILTLAACASAGERRPPICDGKHLRSANPYGSVLSRDRNGTPETPPAAPAPAAAASHSAVAPATFGSCQ